MVFQINTQELEYSNTQELGAEFWLQQSLTSNHFPSELQLPHL